MGVSDAEIQAPHTARVLFLVTLVFVILVVGTILWKFAATIVTMLQQQQGYTVPISVTGAKRFWYNVLTVIVAAAAATIVFMATDLIRREE